MSNLVFVESAPMHGREIPVLAGITVGRDDSDVLLADPEVSRRHATIVESAAGLAIEDLGSTNGTWVNGERIDRAQLLHAGDEVRLGNTVWHVRAVPAPRDGRTTIAGARHPA